MGTLYLVATPIGNLEDISTRALRRLKEAKLIAAEDTRHTRKLLSHFDIHTPLTSYFEHNKVQKLDKIIDALGKGDVALVSDAGTPGLNDPGFLLVRAALEAGYKVSPIPGPSAPLAALVSSGLPTDKFAYLGYLPRKSGERQRAIQEAAELPYTLIWLESPHRMAEALEDLQAILGERQMAVAGELTKLFEEIFRGSIGEAKDYFAEHPARGEYTLVVAGQTEKREEWTAEEVEALLLRELARGNAPSAIAREAAALSGWPRRKVYEMVMQSRTPNKD